MTPRNHARLARRLIDACGGLAEASEACGVSKSVLSTYQNPNEPATMSARVMADLEAYCGEPIYSREIAESRPSAPVAGNALTETHEVVQAAAALLPLAVDMIAGKPGARAAYEAAVAKLVEEVDDVEAIASADVIQMREAR